MKEVNRKLFGDEIVDRTGMLPFAFDAGFGYEAYVDWLLDMPMYFVKRGDTYHDGFVLIHE